jgi:hypothetical protein
MTQFQPEDFMIKKESLLRGALNRVWQNKRYIFWFYVLNVLLAWFGAGAFESQAHAMLDHSLLSDRLVHGFDLGVMVEMLARPEFGPALASATPAMHFALLYFFLTALFTPGVLQGYSTTYRLPREEFFRACGRNLWRFIRLIIMAGILFGVASGVLFGVRAVLLQEVAKSTNELLPFYVSLASFCAIFLVMATLRFGFDLAEADLVLSDQRVVRKSIRLGFRHAWCSLGRLLGAYVLTALIAALALLAGTLLWIELVASESLVGAVVISQLTLLLLLIPRFWQRGIAVTYYLQNMVEPVVDPSFAPFAPTAAAESAPTDAIPAAPQLAES